MRLPDESRKKRDTMVTEMPPELLTKTVTSCPETGLAGDVLVVNDSLFWARAVCWLWATATSY
jgi:hypothetical protein